MESSNSHLKGTQQSSTLKISYRQNLGKYSVLKVKVKVNFSLEQAMKAQRGTRGIALLFL
jgi:hypothetical protein